MNKKLKKKKDSIYLVLLLLYVIALAPLVVLQSVEWLKIDLNSPLTSIIVISVWAILINFLYYVVLKKMSLYKYNQKSLDKLINTVKFSTAYTALISLYFSLTGLDDLEWFKGITFFSIISFGTLSIWLDMYPLKLKKKNNEKVKESNIKTRQSSVHFYDKKNHTWFYVILFSILLLIQMSVVSNNFLNIGCLPHYIHVILMVVQYISIEIIMTYNLKKANVDNLIINRQRKILIHSCINVALITLIILLSLAQRVNAKELTDIVEAFFKLSVDRNDEAQSIVGVTILVSILLLLAIIYKNYNTILDAKQDILKIESEK